MRRRQSNNRSISIVQRFINECGIAQVDIAQAHKMEGSIELWAWELCEWVQCDVVQRYGDCVQNVLLPSASHLNQRNRTLTTTANHIAELQR